MNVNEALELVMAGKDRNNCYIPMVFVGNDLNLPCSSVSVNSDREEIYLTFHICEFPLAWVCNYKQKLSRETIFSRPLDKPAPPLLDIVAGLRAEMYALLVIVGGREIPYTIDGKTGFIKEKQ